MDKKSVDKTLLIASVILFLAMSASFLIMPLDMYDEELQSSTVNLISGLCFWISLIAGSAMHVLLANRRKQSIKRHKKAMDGKQRIGVISFFENRFAMIADLVLIISFIACVVVLVFTSGSEYFCYILFTLFVFSFCMHCVLNGKNFKFVAEKSDDEIWKAERDRDK